MLIFVLGLTRPGIEPMPTVSVADTPIYATTNRRKLKIIKEKHPKLKRSKTQLLKPFYF